MSFKFPTILGSNSLAQRQEEAGSLANFYPSIEFGFDVEKRRKGMKGIFIIQCNVQQDDGNFLFQLVTAIDVCHSLMDIKLWSSH